jgi:nucleoside phosphorylase/NTP pyrophosphatase (non-canonical NTP hydrolase)
MVSSNKNPSLDDLYHMVAHIYSDKNAERPISVTFSHFVEVCGMMTIHAKKKNRDEVNMESSLCKTLGWFFPLMARLKVRSVQELIYRKYPNVCPYCRLPVHKEEVCKQALGTVATVNHEELRKIYQENKSQMPHSLTEWQEMFNRIYPRDIDKKQMSVISLFEELGEFAEALRIFETHPKYVAGEAADVFSYIMGIASEHSIKRLMDGKTRFDFEKEFLSRYPGLCPQCGYQVCVCPIIPETTVGRMAKELDLLPDDNLFTLNVNESESIGKKISNVVIDNFGGLIEYVKSFPFDRGDTNRAIVAICVRLASNFIDKRPDIAKEMQDIAIKISQKHKRAGAKSDEKEIDEIINVLERILPEVDVSIFDDDGMMNKKVAKDLLVQTCKIGIVTALPKEFAAVKVMFEESFDYYIPTDPNNYVIGKIKSKKGGGHHWVALVLMRQYGNNSSAIASTNLQRSFQQIKDVIMVGIAGGIPFPQKPEAHVRLGDIVVSDSRGIVQYDNLKKEIDKITLRDSSSKPSAKLVGIIHELEAERLQSKYPWEQYIKEKSLLIENGQRPSNELDILYEYDSSFKATKISHPVDASRRPNNPRVHYGIIGAANTLLKDPHLRDKLRNDCNVIAIEMEGSGIAESSWYSGNQYLIVRGICDYCDPQKDDIWQGYAAICAASYARSIIENIALASE